MSLFYLKKNTTAVSEAIKISIMDFKKGQNKVCMKKHGLTYIDELHEKSQKPCTNYLVPNHIIIFTVIDNIYLVLFIFFYNYFSIKINSVSIHRRTYKKQKGT